jgi:hypothetical protein
MLDPMMIHQVYKGICGMGPDEAETRLRERGIASRWWNRGVGPDEILAQLTETALMRHLNDYDAFGPTTPFISTTAGSVVRDANGQVNVIETAEYVATDFATDGFTSDGWVFSGYVFTLGRKAVRQQPFAEEVRELNIYTGYLPFQPEGELVAKFHLPAVQLEEAWPVMAQPDPNRPGAMLWPRKGRVLRNDGVYVPPEDIVNVREVL